MSELIDRIFDVTAISKEVVDIITELTKVTTSINGFKDAVVSLEAATRKSKGTEELINNSKLLNDIVIKGGVEMKRYEAEIEKLRQKTEQLTTSEKAASIEIAKARLELQAAQKATKEAAISEIELTSKNKDLSGSYNALQKDLSSSIKAYKSLSGEEAKGAKGRDLLNKIGETQVALKKSDAAMGNYQRNVGNYASALEGLTPKLGGLAGTLLDIATAAKKNKKEMDDLSNANNLGFKSMGEAPKGLSTIIAGFKGLGKTVGAVGKALLANPIGIVVAAIVSAFALMKKAVDSNGEATRKLGQVLAPLKMLLGSIVQVISKLVTGVLDGVLAFGSFLNAVMSYIPGLDKLAEKNKQAIELEKEKQRLIREGIVDKAYDAKEELRIAELKKQIMEKQKYSSEERLAMAKEVDRAEKALAMDDARRANENLKNFLRNMKQMGKTQKDFNEDEMKQLADLQTAKYSEQQKYFDRTKKLASRVASLNEEIAADEQKAKDEAAKAEQERSDKILAARRRLVDSQLAMIQDGEKKQLAVSAENFKRQIEDLQKNGELTKQLKSNLEKAQQMELEKIRTEFASKRLADNMKIDELEIARMQKLGLDTIKEQKALLKKQMDAEIAAGGDKVQIYLKYQYLQDDLEEQNNDKKIARFEETIKKESDLINQEYQKKENLLKKDFLNSKRTAEDKEKLDRDLAQLKLDALYEVNEKTIQALEKELATGEISTDKRAELSNKLAQLRIDNENAVLDASVKTAEEQAKEDEIATQKRIATMEALANATVEIFGAIADFAIQQSENRIIELEKEQEASDAMFEKEQGNLDNALMSDENRAIKQQELDDKKAAADKALADKIQAEKIKQAKWDKANGIVQAIITTGLAILKASLTVPFIPMGLIAAGLAATMGAAQVATIASQPIPAYEKGGTTGDGLALWGEKRAEVAVTPSGETFLAEKPTISNFDAGTKIYDSVQAYENAIGKQSIKEFSFDYDKMGEKMKPQNIILDSRGLWGIVSQQNNRRTLLNRRYSIK